MAVTNLKFLTLFSFSLALVACGGGSSEQTSSTTLTPTGSEHDISIALESSARVTTQIGAAGGVLETQGADGILYNLAFPAGSLMPSESLAVSMTPVSSVDGLPVSGAPIAAIHFEPDGTTLLSPATLSVTLNRTLDKAQLLAYSYEGAGENLTFIPIESFDSSSTIATIQIHHFSGAGLAVGNLSDMQGNSAQPGTADHYRQKVAIIEREALDRGIHPYSDAETLAKLSAVFVDWFNGLIRDDLLGLAEAGFDTTKIIATKYLIWLSNLQELQCKISGCGPSPMPSCFAVSQLDPLLDQFRSFAASSFFDHYQGNISRIDSTCSLLFFPCSQKPLIEEGYAWIELAQFGGVSYEPCMDAGGSDIALPEPGLFCGGAEHNILSEIIFTPGLVAALPQGDQIIYELAALDLRGEPIQETDRNWAEVWSNLGVSWDSRDPAIAEIQDITPNCVPACSKGSLVTTIDPGLALLSAKVSGDGVCDSNGLSTDFELTVLPDTTAPIIGGGNTSQSFYNVDNGATVVFHVSGSDGSRQQHPWVGELRQGSGVASAKFYFDNSEADGPGALIGESNCVDDNCSYSMQLPACAVVSTFGGDNTVYGWGAQIVDGVGNESQYRSLGSYSVGTSIPAPCQ